MKRLVTVVALAALSLSACAAQGTQNEKSGASPSSYSSDSPGVEQGKALKAADDPRSLSGLTEVADIADPTPIEGSYTQKLPAKVTDFEGNSVTITDTSRILALDVNGTLSRTVISLGLGDSIVGRTISSTETKLSSLPVVTQGGHQLNAEAILALKPSVVIADRSVGPVEVIDQIRAAGIPVVLVNPKRTIANTNELITAVANALGMEEAGKALNERTAQEIAKAKEQIAAWAPKEALDVAFLYVRGTAGIFFILGAEDGATELIQGVGAKDVAAAHGLGSTTPANAEALIAVNPEVIFVMREGLKSTGGIEGLLSRAGVAQTRAGQKQRVISIPDGISLAFGPQTGEVLIAVAKAMYGVQE